MEQLVYVSGLIGRANQLKKYAASKGTDWTDEDTQIEFLIGELTKGGGANGYASFQMSGTYDGYTYSSWKDATDIEEATIAFRKVFERCGESEADDSTRIQKAKEYYEEFQGRERSGGTYTSSNSSGDIIGTFTSSITGATFTIFNQNSDGLGKSWGSEWTSYCNKCVAATIATGYNGGDTNSALSRTLNWGSLMSNMTNTNAYFSIYGLSAKEGSYSVNNIKSALTSGSYVGMRFLSGAYGKSGNNWGGSDGHWIVILGYKNEDGNEQIFVADSALGNTGWYSIDEFESCKNYKDGFTIVSPD